MEKVTKAKLPGFIKLNLFLALILSSSFGIAREIQSASSPLAPSAVAKEIKTELINQSSVTITIDEVVRKWNRRFGNLALEPLWKIIKSSPNLYSDQQRYVALIAFGRIGGLDSIPKLIETIKDNSWMIRSGSLRMIGTIMTANKSSSQSNPTSISQVEHALSKALNDPAIAVRIEAVHTIRALKLSSMIPALIANLYSPENYHAGKSQWVPEKILDTLVELKAAPSTSKSLKALLDHKKDPALQKKTVETLEMLHGKMLRNNGTLNDRVTAWKKNISGQYPD
jgi:hypothetical protein